MDNYKVCKFLFLIIVTITCLLEFLSNFFGPYIKFIDDITILFLIIYLIPRNFTNLDTHTVALTKLVVFFFIISLVSGIINFEFFDLKPYLIQLKNYFFTFAVLLFAIFLYNESYSKLIIKIYLLVSSILALIGILEYFFKYHFFITYTPFGDLMAINPFRSYSLIGNPVDFAFYLIVPFLISLFSKRYLLSIFFLLAISTTLSLGNFSIILLLSIISFFLKILEKKIFIIILIILTVFIFNNDFVRNRISGKLEVAKFSPLDEEASRFNFYIQSSDVIKDNFLLSTKQKNYVNTKNNIDDILFNLEKILDTKIPLRKYDINQIDKKYHNEALRLLPNENYIGFSITQGNKYRKKTWPIERFINLANRLNNQIPVFFIEKNNLELIKEISSCVKTAIFPETNTLLSCPALITTMSTRLNKAITIDNGIMHMMSLANIPMITLFGPTNPDKFAPKNKNIKILDSKKIYNSDDISKITEEDILNFI